MTNIAAAPGRAAVVLISNSEIDCSIIYLLSLHVCRVLQLPRTDIASMDYNVSSGDVAVSLPVHAGHRGCLQLSQMF